MDSTVQVFRIHLKAKPSYEQKTGDPVLFHTHMPGLVMDRKRVVKSLLLTALFLTHLEYGKSFAVSLLLSQCIGLSICGEILDRDDPRLPGHLENLKPRSVKCIGGSAKRHPYRNCATGLKPFSKAGRWVEPQFGLARRLLWSDEKDQAYCKRCCGEPGLCDIIKFL